MLGARQRREIIILFFLTLVMAVLDTLGIASIMPFISVLYNPEIIETNKYLKWLYEYLEFSNREEYLVFLGIATFVLLISSVVFRSLTLWAQLRFTHLGIHIMACRMIDSYVRQPYAWFLNRHSADLGSRILSEVSNVFLGVYYPVLMIVTNVLVTVCLVLLLLVVDPVLALGSIILLGGMYYLVFFATRHFLVKIGEERVRANQARYRVLNEVFGGIKDVKSSNLEEKFTDRFTEPSSVLARHSITNGIISEMPTFVLQGLVFGGVILFLIYLISAYDSMESAIPVVALYALAGFRLLPALQGAYRNLSKLKFNTPVMDALYDDIVNLQETRETKIFPSTDNNRDLLSPLSEIALKNVNYSYPGSDTKALDSICFEIPAKKSIALVGSSGSGKTTLVDVILGLLYPNEGCIRIDGKEVDDENIVNWQKSIGYVSQHIFLSEGSIASNIAFGYDEIDYDAVNRAVIAAQLGEFVSDQPDGVYTLIGENGARLSGGQRQRIGIARALYKNPPVLIFDEATSALDNVSENAVMDAIDNLSGEKTIIMIAHRLTSIRACDMVHYLEAGRIVASGDFDSLYQTCPQFKQMVDTGGAIRSGLELTSR